MHRDLRSSLGIGIGKREFRGAWKRERAVHRYGVGPFFFGGGGEWPSFVWHVGRVYEFMVYDMRCTCTAALYSRKGRRILK